MTPLHPPCLSAATGEPTHDKEGAALEGKALDKARKEVEKQKKASFSGGLELFVWASADRPAMFCCWRGTPRQASTSLLHASCCPPARLPPRMNERLPPQVRAPLETKLAKEPTFLATLAADVAALTAELAALGVNGSS